MRLLPLAAASTLAVLAAGCGDHLVDHDSPDLFVPTTIVTTVACDPGACPAPDPTWTGARAACIGPVESATCGYECTGGLVQCDGGCCPLVQVSAGSTHTCAISGAPAAGALYCWGGNAFGQVTGTAGADVRGPFRARASGVTAVATGKSHTCAVVSGAIECWGAYDDGTSLGLTVGGVTNPGALAAGDSHTCALEGGTVKCWGSSTLGQRGGSAAVAQPVTGATAIAAGANHTCARVSGDAVKCWGAGAAGQLGLDPAPDSTTTANTVVTLSAIGAVGAGGNLGCGAAQSARGGGIDDALQCWGTGLGALFSATTQKTPAIPMKTTDQSVVRFQVHALAVGRAHVCVKRGVLNEPVKCLGADNTWGQLGGLTPVAPEPLEVGGTQNAIAFAAGADHACAIMSTGGLECWGRNSSGQLGDGTAVTPGLDGDARGLGTPAPLLGRSTVP